MHIVNLHVVNFMKFFYTTYQVRTFAKKHFGGVFYEKKMTEKQMLMLIGFLTPIAIILMAIFFMLPSP